MSDNTKCLSDNALLDDESLPSSTSKAIIDTSFPRPLESWRVLYVFRLDSCASSLVARLTLIGKDKLWVCHDAIRAVVLLQKEYHALEK